MIRIAVSRINLQTSGWLLRYAINTVGNLREVPVPLGVQFGRELSILFGEPISLAPFFVGLVPQNGAVQRKPELEQQLPPSRQSSLPTTGARRAPARCRRTEIRWRETKRPQRHRRLPNESARGRKSTRLEIFHYSWRSSQFGGIFAQRRGKHKDVYKNHLGCWCAKLG